MAPEGKEEERRGGAGGVKFTLGHEDDDDEEEVIIINVPCLSRLRVVIYIYVSCQEVGE